jgi:DNA (cytosine-5)-methyltransferase 1
MRISKIRFFDMFAGIGGFRAGLSLIEGYECVGHCEINEHADKSYRAVHNPSEKEWYAKDARTIEPGDMPDFDLLCGGFPCQAFSNAGLRGGFADPRCTLFFEIARLARAKRPAYLLLENVPGLLSHDKGRTFAAILAALCDLGYSVEWHVLNSKDFGVPQSRRRVFIIGYLDVRCAGKILPVRETNAKALIQLIAGAQGSRVYDPEGLSCTLTSGAGGMGGKTGLYAVGFNRKEGVTSEIDTAYALNASNFRGLNRNQTQNAVFVDMCYGDPKVTDMARCLTANYSKSRMSHRKAERSGVLLIQEATKKGYKEANVGDSVNLGFAGSKTRRGRVGKDIAHTLESGRTQGVITPGSRIRRLTPRECLRLQGFTEGQIDKILAITSDSQAYAQAGNSVTVNVIYALGLRIKAMDDELKAGDPA